MLFSCNSWLKFKDVSTETHFFRIAQEAVNNAVRYGKAKNIIALYPNLPILILSMHDETLFAERTFRAGANGYLMKQEGTEKVIAAICKIMEGKIYLSESMNEALLQKAIHGNATKESTPIQQLSDRELGVFELIGQRLWNKTNCH